RIGNGASVRRNFLGGNGIFVDTVSVFSGGVTNGGTISAVGAAVFLHGISTFTGDILNTGAISAAFGIAVGNSTILGAIVDSGSIKAISGGILIDSASEVLAASR